MHLEIVTVYFNVFITLKYRVDRQGSFLRLDVMSVAYTARTHIKTTSIVRKTIRRLFNFILVETYFIVFENKMK